MVRHGFALPARVVALPWSVAGPQTLHWNSMAESIRWGLLLVGLHVAGANDGAVQLFFVAHVVAQLGKREWQ